LSDFSLCFPLGSPFISKQTYNPPFFVFGTAVDPHTNFVGKVGVGVKPLSYHLGLALAGFLFVCAALFPLRANAGVFSFFAELFAGEAETQTAAVGNAQNMALLVAAQNPDPNPAKGGGDITIIGGTALLPETGPSGTLADVSEGQPSEAISLYVVRDGDTLGAIAKMFGVSVNTIVWANDRKNGTIRPGETLVILPISGVRHTIAKGDTIQSIAKKYRADADEILLFNGIAPYAPLAAGDVILVPDGELAAVQLVAPRVRGLGGPSYDGYYLRPLLGGRKTQGLHGYNGVDMATYYGAPILASAAGQVIISRDVGWNGGYGKYIVIAHGNGTQTLYAHNSQNAVFAGQNAVRGQIIGYVGSTGRSTGSHLHFEVRGARNPF